MAGEYEETGLVFDTVDLVWEVSQSNVPLSRTLSNESIPVTEQTITVPDKPVDGGAADDACKNGHSISAENCTSEPCEQFCLNSSERNGCDDHGDSDKYSKCLYNNVDPPTSYWELADGVKRAVQKILQQGAGEGENGCTGKLEIMEKRKEKDEYLEYYIRPGPYTRPLHNVFTVYSAVQYPRRYNKCVPNPVRQQLEMYSPEKLRDALMNKMSLEDRESLLIDEGWRRKTFLDSAWPHNTNGITPATMARTGLYYTGNADCVDRVQCVFCRGVMHSWRAGDEASLEHAKYFRFCRLVQRQETGNIEYMGGETESRTFENVLKNIVRVPSSRDNVPALTSLGIGQDKPLSPERAMASSREATFRSGFVCGLDKDKWHLLWEAGFSWSRFRDLVQCFWCGGELERWLLSDDPWEEHARWYGDCGFLIKEKGLEWIREVHDNTPTDKKNSKLIRWNMLTNPDEDKKSTSQTLSVHFLKFCRMRGYSERLIRRVIALNGGPFNRYRELILALHDAQELEEMDDEVIPESVQESVPEPEPMEVAPTKLSHEPWRNRNCRSKRHTHQPIPKASFLALPCGDLLYCEDCLNNTTVNRVKCPICDTDIAAFHRCFPG